MVESKLIRLQEESRAARENRASEQAREIALEVAHEATLHAGNRGDNGGFVYSVAATPADIGGLPFWCASPSAFARTLGRHFGGLGDFVMLATLAFGECPDAPWLASVFAPGISLAMSEWAQPSRPLTAMEAESLAEQDAREAAAIKPNTPESPDLAEALARVLSISTEQARTILAQVTGGAR